MIKNNDEIDSIKIITIAIWKDEQSLNDAKKSVKAEYKRISFDPVEFNQKLNIKMRRNIYSYLE